MLEKFYIVTEKSPLHKEYFEWKQNTRDVNEFVKDFTHRHEIEATEYSATNERFYIVPTENDKAKFSSQLSLHELGSSLHAFKKNSRIGLAWIQELKTREITVLYKPHSFLYVHHSYGESSSRLFDINGTLYMSFCSDGNFEVENGIKEILGSTFYKAIENFEARS